MERRIGAATLVKHVGAPTNSGATYSWLASALERLICDGVLAYDTRLPGERSAASALGLSRTTVSHAYDVLRERGFAEAVQGSGTRVRIPGGPVTGGGEPLADFTADVTADAAGSTSSGRGVLMTDPVGPGMIDMRTAAPTAISGLHSAYERALDQLGSYSTGGGYFRDGVPKLRELLAARYTRRGVPTRPDQILVTTGALSGLAATVSGLLSGRQRVLVESTGYPNTWAALRRSGARLVPAPDGERDVTGSGYAALTARSGAHAALLSPDFHNPTGHLMSDVQRERIADAWQRHNVLGIVDETLLDTWWDAPITAAPMARYTADCITVGSASKTIWGGLRVGWVRAPRAYVGAIASARQSLDLGAPVLEQLVTAELLGSRAAAHTGGLDADRRQSLRAARDRVWRRITDGCPGWEATVPSGGLCLWWRLPQMNSSAIVAEAAKHGLALTRGAPFSPDGRGLEGRLRTPFTLDAERLDRAVDILIDVNRTLAGG